MKSWDFLSLKETCHLNSGLDHIQAKSKLSLTPHKARAVYVRDDNEIVIHDLANDKEVAGFRGDASIRTVISTVLQEEIVIAAGDKNGSVWCFEFVE